MNIADTSLPLGAAAQGSTRAGAGQGHWFARAGAAIGRALEASGRARARRQLLDFAARCEAAQPELAKELRAASGHDTLA